MLTFKGGQNHITNGNNMRFKSDDQIALDQNWLNELTPESSIAGLATRALIQYQGAPMNNLVGAGRKKNGYPGTSIECWNMPIRPRNRYA